MHTLTHHDSPQTVYANGPEVVETTSYPELADRKHYDQMIHETVEGKTPSVYDEHPHVAQKESDRLWGLTATRFWCLIALIGLIIIGVTVGGAAGGVAAVRSKQCPSATIGPEKAGNCSVQTNGTETR